MANRPRSKIDDDSRYRMLVEAVTDYAIYMLDPAGIVSSWNAGAQRFKGYAPAEILGKHFSRFYTEEDQRAGLPARTLEIATREGRFESEGWRVRKDGTRFWASVVVDPIRSEHGELVGFAKVTRDLTERKADRSESASNVKNSSDCWCRGSLITRSTCSIRMDASAAGTPVRQRIKGYLPAEIIGQHFSRFYTAEDVENGDPQKALEIASTRGKLREGGLARPQGRLSVLGSRGARSRSRRQRRHRGICEGYARHH